ncbi:MAG: SPOR domain-containing protein [Parvularcula sp.]|jgi:hypothetical protein|nr:SPOR domain-containing protein [Parvularcula sp.]
MRTIYRHAAILLALGAGSIDEASAQQTALDGQPIIIPSQSSVFNQNSVNLPGAPSVSGQDMIRGADGTTCQSAVASGGPYLDFGVLQSADVYARESAALYGRVVVPIGRRAKRVDCSKLYNLEIERLKMEVELLKMGLGGSAAPRLVSNEPPPEDLPITEPDEVGAIVGAAPVPPSSLPGADAVGLNASVPAAMPSEHGKLRQGYYAQLGAFSSLARAEARLLALSQAAKLGETRVAPLKGQTRTLFRALIGPMGESAAKEVCASLPGDCLVTEES